jgi:CHAD domain-containing protein
MREVLEREDKWDVDDRFTLPDLEGVLAGGTVTHDTVDLISEYYDTPQRDLQAHDVLLRRRSGDDDTGWQLKMPAADGRTELHWPLTDAPPDSLKELLTGLSLGKDVGSVATVHTIRSRYRIRDGEADDLLAELADDQVRAWTRDKLVAWRELEVELGPSTPSMPKALVKTLTAAGARPSRFASKLAHVLPPAPTENVRSKAVRAVVAYVGAQIDAIVAGDIGLRRGQDPIHDTRVAMRRLRSTLRVFGAQLDPAAVGGLEDELKWFAGLLGAVRDCQVQHDRFGTALDQIPDELVLGPVRSRVRNDLQAIELPARARVREVMDSPRYLAILATLREWRVNPPVVRGTTTEEVLESARTARRKADRRLIVALDDGEDATLHRARKAAKRARYAAELCQGLGGSKRNPRISHRYKAIQAVLGDHQDSVVAAATLRRLGAAAGTTDGENGFTFGLLLAGEQRVAEQSRAAARKLIHRRG